MKRVLVIIDFQKDFVDGALGSEAAQKIVDPLVNYITNFNGDVIGTKDTHTNDYLNTQEGLNLPIPHCIKNTPGWEYDEKITPYIKRTVYKSTFGSTYLAELIKKEQYDIVEFCGLVTDICVVSNVLLTKSINPEIEILVHKDFCAGTTPEAHEAALLTMKSCQIKII